MINLTIKEAQLARAAKRCREKGVIIPTLAQLKNPESAPRQVKERLKQTGLWDIAPENLFRITWKNEPVQKGGLFKPIANHIELPPELTGVEARIIALEGKWFPTGSHKVGASFGCLIPALVTGQFDPTKHKAVWPSTGNFCRGGAYDATLLGCESIAILPEQMSQERFNWLKTVAGEIVVTPGGESNVKEIYDKVAELKRTRKDIYVFNQFAEFGNYLFHYDVTGHAIEEVIKSEMKGGRFQGVCFTTGSAGTIASGDYLKKVFPESKIAAGEALQCPTLLRNGYGSHRIEGIGDKHIPWIHNVRNTDLVIDIDDEDSISIMRLFNEEEGRRYLKDEIGISEDIVSKLDLLGISSISNVLMAVKFAKYYELTRKDIVLTVFTDSMEMYQSRLGEARKAKGNYSKQDAIRDFHRRLMATKTDSMLELDFNDRRRIHNLKYFTWIEQQGFDVRELDRQWYDYDAYWSETRKLPPNIDDLIGQFNDRVNRIR